MNKTMIKRLKKAGEYQKKAILALLPERTAGHLDVIGNEMKQMVAEMLPEMLPGSCKKEKAPEAEQAGNVKKVSID